MTKTKSCSIFFYEGWLSIAPTVINLATFLAKADYQTTIYTRNNKGFEKLEHLDSRIKLVEFDQPKGLEYFIKVVEKIHFGSLVPIINLVVFTLQVRIYQLRSGLSNSRESISIGVDTDGSITAFLESFFVHSRLVYLSLELSETQNFRNFDRLRILAERLVYRKSACILIQDQSRFARLNAFSKYSHPSVFYLANSVSSSQLMEQTDLASKNYFRELFELSEAEHPYLIVQAGWIGDLVCSKELATAFARIDPKFSLIFHERRKRELDDPYIKTLRKVNSTNLFLSLTPLPYEEIDRVFASATVSLAFYQPINENFAQIAKASGKLSGYLKHGKPVLMSNLDSLRQLNGQYQFGIVIQDPTNSVEIEQALERILSNYEFYSQNALACYRREFDFETQANPFLEFICSERRKSSSILTLN